MRDFKAQLEKDMETFHNPGEFASIMNIWYDGKRYEIPVVMDHTAATEREAGSGDHAEGINKLEALAFIALADLGFVPKRGRQIEFEEAGAIITYRIEKSDCEEGEIILELGAFDE